MQLFVLKASKGFRHGRALPLERDNEGRQLLEDILRQIESR
jgi:hypothetical protein